MNPTTNGKALSEFLEGVVAGKLLKPEVALEANKLPTHELQEQALDMFGDDKRVMQLIVRDLLHEASQPAISSSLAAPDFMAAIREDVLDRYLPGMGSIKTWIKWVVILWAVSFLWSPFWWLVKAPFRWGNHLIKSEVRTMATAVPAPTQAQVPVPTPAPVPVTLLPAPTGFKSELLNGKNIHFTWNPVAGCAGYNFYSTHTRDMNYHKENPKPLPQAEAYWRPGEGLDDYKFLITAVDAHDREGAFSQPLDVDLR
jgi:hypothetical protein